MAENITYIVENLFPQGVDNIPTELDIENKIKTGTFTVRDAILLKLYQDGINFGPEDVETNPSAVKKIKEIFTKSAPVSRFVNYTKTYEAALGKPYFDVFTGSESGTAQQLAELFGTKVKKGEGKRHQAIDRLVTTKYSQLGVERPRAGTIISPQVKGQDKKTKAEKGTYPPGFQMWNMITGAASDMVSAGENKIASAWLFHNMVPLRAADLFHMTVDPEYSRAGKGGVARPLLRKIGDELLLTVIGEAGKDKKRIIQTFVLTDFQKNIILPYYNAAIEQLELKKNYIKEGGTAANYRKEFKASNHLDGRLFYGIEGSYGKNIIEHFGPKLATYEGIITGVQGKNIVRKIQGDMIGRNYDDATAALILAQMELDPTLRNTTILRNFYKAQEKVQNIDITKHGQTDPLTYIFRRIENDISLALKYNDVNKIASNAGVVIENINDKIAVNKNTGISDTEKPRTAAERKQFNKELQAASDERVAKFQAGTAEAIATTVETNVATQNTIKQYAKDNNITISEAKKIIQPEGRGRPAAQPSIGTSYDPIVMRLAKKYNIKPEKLAGLTLKEMMAKVKNLTPSKKVVKKIGKVGIVGGMGFLAGYGYVTDPAQAAGEEIAYGAGRLGVKALGFAGGPATMAGVLTAEAFAAKEAGAPEVGASEKEMFRIADVAGPDKEGVYNLEKAGALAEFGEIETEAELKRGTHPRIEEAEKLRDEELDRQMFQALGAL